MGVGETRCKARERQSQGCILISPFFVSWFKGQSPLCQWVGNYTGGSSAHTFCHSTLKNMSSNPYFLVDLIFRLEGMKKGREEDSIETLRVRNPALLDSHHYSLAFKMVSGWCRNPHLSLLLSLLNRTVCVGGLGICMWVRVEVVEQQILRTSLPVWISNKQISF